MRYNDEWRGTYEIFQHPPFAEMYARFTGRVCIHLGNLLGLLSSQPGFGNTRLRVYNCVNVDDKTLREIESGAQKNHVAKLWLNTVSPCGYFKIQPTATLDTLIMDLTNDNQHLWKLIGSNTRRKINRCARDAAESAVVTEDKEFKEWWDIYIHTAGNKRFASQPYPLVRAVFEDHKLSTLVAVRKAGKVVGGMLFLNHLYPVYWLGGFDRAHRTYIGYFNLWSAMLHFKERNYSVIDLGGVVSSGNHGPTQFKNAFNAELRRSYVYDMRVEKIRGAIVGSVEYFRSLFR